MKTGVKLWLYSGELFVEPEIFLTEDVEKIKIHIFMFNIFIEKLHHL